MYRMRYLPSFTWFNLGREGKTEVASTKASRRDSSKENAMNNSEKGKHLLQNIPIIAKLPY